MRPPRFQFPNEVRSTTRGIASRMVDDGEIARSPEQLDAWIGQRPEIRESLAADGYGAEFTADDLFPLLQVFVEKAGGPPLEAVGAPRASSRRWLMFAVAAAAVIVVVVLALTVGVRPG